MSEPLGLAKQLCDEAKIYGLKLCHWKSNQRLGLSVQGLTDLDFSIPPEQESELIVILKHLGFVEFRSRAWQRYSGVTDWLGVDLPSGVMLHLHLHTRLLTGLKSIKEQDLPWLEKLNDSVCIDQETGFLIPPKAFEAHLLLTREAIKSMNIKGVLKGIRNKVPVSVETRNEMSWLLECCELDSLAEWGRRLWGPERWGRMQPFFTDNNVWQVKEFMALRSEISEALSPYHHGFWLKNTVKFITMRLWAHLDAVNARLTGATATGKRLLADSAPVIAIVGSDGAGKSTVVADLEKWLSWKADIAVVYMGTNHAWFRKLRKIILNWKKSKNDKSYDKKTRGANAEYSLKFPMWVQPLKWAVMARVRLHLLRKALRLTRKGTIVLADRYPQIEVQGIFDGPSRLDAPGLNWFGRLLQLDEHGSFRRMSTIKPDLVIKLMAPLDVALSRKPDHDPNLIASKIELTRRLQFGGVETVEVDTSLPLETVLLDVRRHIWNAVRKKTE